MGMYEDDRIRRKNAMYSGYWYSGEADDGNDDVAVPTANHTLKIEDGVSIADIVLALKTAGFKVELGYHNTITVKKR